MIRLPSWLRRGLAVLLLVLVLGGIGYLLALPFSILAAQEATLAQLARRAGDLEQRLSTRDQLLAEQRLLERASEADQTLIQADTPALAAALLQRELSALVAQGGGSLESVQALAPVETPPFVRIPVRISFTGSVEGLRSFLYAVEQHAPVLLVDELQVAETYLYGEEDGVERRALATVASVSGFARSQSGGR